MEHLITTFAQHGYAAVLVLMLLESACIPIPSEVTMLFAGFATSPSYGGPRLNLVLIALVGTAGNLLGSWLAYWAGRAGGRPLIERFGRFVLLRPHDIDRAEAWFADHGQAAVFFSRMLPVVRTFISLPAGVAEMPLGRFTLYTVAGCLPWVFGLTIAGRLLGNNWRTIVSSFNVASIVIAAIVAVVVVVWLVRRRRAA